MKDKQWTLGFLGFLGFLAYPSLKHGISWEALYLLNFFWFIKFIPKKKQE